MAKPQTKVEDYVSRINSANVKVGTVWMPCEFVRDAEGRIRVTMLADIEFDAAKRHEQWHLSLEEAAQGRFDQIEPNRKLVLIDARPDETRDLEAFPFIQTLKRDIARVEAELACAA